MRVKLKVLKGASAGKVFEIKVPQFVIGRSSGCQLRPQSDAISRQHCAFLMNEDGVTVRDLGSRNGTLVNGTAITGETRLKTGDEVRVGPLYLQVYCLDDHGAIIKAPRTKTPQEQGASQNASAESTASPAESAAPARVDGVESPKPTRLTSDSGIISDWLLSEDEADKATGLSSVVTRQFQLDDTERIVLEKAAEEGEKAEAEQQEKKKKKKEPGKLPPRKEDESASSQEAAEKTLRQMFTRGL